MMSSRTEGSEMNMIEMNTIEDFSWWCCGCFFELFFFFKST